MGLLDRVKGRPPRPKLPRYVEYSDFPYYSSAGRMFVERALPVGREAVAELQQLSNAQQADVDAVVETVRGLYEMGQELSAIDQQLSEGSSEELDEELGEYYLWATSPNGRPNDKSYSYDRDYGKPRSHYVGSVGEYERRHAKMVEWAAKLPEPQHSEFIRLLERRLEIREAIETSYRHLLATREEIGQAHYKMQIIKAASAVDADAGVKSRPLLTVSNAAEARQRVEAISEGLDEAYVAAVEKAPELSSLDETPRDRLGSLAERPELGF